MYTILYMENILCALLIFIVLLLVWKTYHPSSYPFNIVFVKDTSGNKKDDNRTFLGTLSRILAGNDRADETAANSTSAATETMVNPSPYGMGTVYQGYRGY